MPAAVSRLVLGAQEDLRREIARAMHDGPAQSLTNIVLQAQIVERLVARDPASRPGEVRQLVAMVQQTLDATKSFIFDVRPMVLDDLGLVPTLRRATRERGRRAGVPVEFESLGQDRRLPMDLESGLFRILDEALAAYLGAGPDRVSLRLDWGDQLEARVGGDAGRRGAARGRQASRSPTAEAGKDLPPALAAMIEDRRADERDAVEAAVRDCDRRPARRRPGARSRAGPRPSASPPSSSARASELRLVAEVPAARDAGRGLTATVRPTAGASAGQGLVEYGLILALTAGLTAALAHRVRWRDLADALDRHRRGHRRRRPAADATAVPVQPSIAPVPSYSLVERAGAPYIDAALIRGRVLIQEASTNGAVSTSSSPRFAATRTARVSPSTR